MLRQAALVKETLCHILLVWAVLEPKWAVGVEHALSTIALILGVEATGGPGIEERETRQSSHKHFERTGVPRAPLAPLPLVPTPTAFHN